MNRRKFLVITTTALGVSTLACAAPGLLPGDESQPNPSMPLGFPELTLGDQTMTQKILVTYASTAGSTGGVAEIIAKTLAEGGAAVDVRPMKTVTSLDGYQAVVAGSAIHGGKWLPEAVDFLHANQERLRHLPTAIFLVCMLLAKDTGKNRDFVEQYLAAERALVKPLAEGRFAGALLLDKYPFFSGLGLRIFLAYLGLPAGDYRDPDAIRSWATTIQPLL